MISASRLIGVLLVSAVHLSPVASAQINYSWVNSSGDWMAAVHWSPSGGPPGANDTTYVGNAATVTLNDNTLVRGLVLRNGSSLAGTGDLTTGTLDWSGGAQSGAGATNVTTATNIGDGVAYSIQNLTGGRLLTLGGSSLFQSYRLDFSDASTLINTGNFSSRGDVRGDIVTSNYINNFGSGVFINQGVYTQLSPGCATRIGTAFHNNNTVVISRGTLELTGSGTHNQGLFNIFAPSANSPDTRTLSFIGGTHLLSGGEIVNNGLIQIGAATVTLDAASLYHGDGDIQTGNGTLTFNHITNTGTFTSAGDVRGDAVTDNFIPANGSGQVFNNAGLYVQDSGSKATRISVPFSNTGEVRVDAGQLIFNASFIMLGDDSALNLPVTGLTNNALDLNAPAALDGTAQDPDHDGIENLLEFVLGGNPLAASSSVLPAATRVANDLVFSFSRNDESETEVALVFQYSTDLIRWTDLPIDAVTTAPVIIAENGASPDAITIAIPQENRAALFGRLRAVTR